jgi:DNA polymerase-3 subunit gamma/tau
MLTKEAFNALLKSLEEPPSHTVFILATTEVDALPKTIVSRCIRINFNRAERNDIVHMLERIVKGENLTLQKESLDVIAHIAEGSFRDAAKMLEIVSLNDDTSPEAIKKALGVSTNMTDLLLSLAHNDPTAALQWVMSAREQGTDFKFIIEQLLDILHNELLSKYHIEKGSKELASLTVKQSALLISLLQKAYGQLKISPIASLPLELALVEYCAQQEALIKN